MTDRHPVEGDTSWGAVPLILGAIAFAAACFLPWALLALMAYPTRLVSGDDASAYRVVGLSRGAITSELVMAAILAITLTGLAVALTLRAIEARRAGIVTVVVGLVGVSVVIVERAAIASAVAKTQDSYGVSPGWIAGPFGTGPMLILAGAVVALGGGIWLIVKGAPSSPRHLAVTLLASALVGVIGVAWIASTIRGVAGPMERQYETTSTEYVLLLDANLVTQVCGAQRSCADATATALTTAVTEGQLSGSGYTWLRYVDGSTASPSGGDVATSVSVGTGGSVPIVGLARMSTSGECLLLTVTSQPPDPAATMHYGAGDPSACTGSEALAKASAPSDVEGGWTVLGGGENGVWPSLFLPRHGSGGGALVGA